MFMIILKILLALGIAFISLCLLFVWLGETEEDKHMERLMRERYGFYDRNLQPHEHRKMYEKMKGNDKNEN